MFETWLPNLIDLLQILILTAGIYGILKFLHSTRAFQILIGLVALLLLLFVVTTLLQLDVLGVVLKWTSFFFFFVLLVIFHQELRLALIILGRNTYRRLMQGRIPEPPAEALIKATRRLARERIGALIAIERTDDLTRLAESGIALDALLGEELAVAIFTPPLPLHDGGIVIRGKRVLAAHCIFPINNELRLDGMGTRHRAALTLSAETDSLVLIVSEERGQVSVARDGKLLRDLDDRQVLRFLRAAFVPKEKQRDFFSLVFGSRPTAPWFVRLFTIKEKRLIHQRRGENSLMSQEVENV